ncbi:uncharacterized protein LOC142338266 [Convolutriloba macropyga]|uniref:uncharacterized protein LOC142338266 n=1 Tax=Convolutriloba macropyga TaxID=536237 RepID=UPI003F528EC5
MMKMSLLQPTLVAFLAFLIHNVNVEADQSKCYPGSTFLQGSSMNYCLYLVNVTLGPMNFTEAKNQCSAPFPSFAGYVVWTRGREHLGQILDWAIKEGLPTDSQAGFWTVWIRKELAPLEPNGTLSQENEDIRKNRNLFVDEDFPQNVMPNDLWRNETQPGNALDGRDEWCTAQSRPGMQPEYFGLDDYECNGTQLHYAVCQIEFIQTEG